MNIDAIKADSLLSVENIKKINLQALPTSTVMVLDALLDQLMQNVVLINAIQELRNSHPAAALKVELYLEGIE